MAVSIDASVATVTLVANGDETGSEQETRRRGKIEVKTTVRMQNFPTRRTVRFTCAG